MVVICGGLAVECWASVVNGRHFSEVEKHATFLKYFCGKVFSESGLSVRILAARGNGPKAYLSTGPSVQPPALGGVGGVPAVGVERFEELG